MLNADKLPIDDMVRGYISSILLNENDYEETGPVPMHLKYGGENFAKETIGVITKDCANFLALAIHSAPEIIQRPGLFEIGRDFWLTRNAHGAGFEDGNYSRIVGVKLYCLCKKFKPLNVYASEDGFIYFE